MKLFQTRLHVGQKQLATLTTASKIFRSSWLAQETENKSWTLRVFLVLLAAFVSSVSTRKKIDEEKTEKHQFTDSNKSSVDLEPIQLKDKVVL